MKKILLIVSVFVAEFCYSQEKFSFVDDNMEWSYITVESWDENPNEPSGRLPAMTTVRYKYIGDTNVNSFVYKKMFRTLNNGLTWTQICNIREEDKRIYSLVNGKEKLIYRFDYDLNEKSIFWSDKINYIDTVLIAGSEKVRFGIGGYEDNLPSMLSSIELFSFHDCVIEDIGGLYAPRFDTKFPATYDITGSTEMSYLLCVKKGGKVIYHNTSYDDCYYYRERTAVKFIDNPQISLSPNPVKDILTLTLPTDNNEIKIYDLQGKLLLQQNVGFSAEINVSMLPAGTYVLVVNNSERLTFIKQ